jgi:hypothetical protein
MNFAQTRKVILAGRYDFAVYGYFATDIGQAFFPNQDRVAQLLSAFGVFALGYLMRPLGGAVTGRRRGWRKSLHSRQGARSFSSGDDTTICSPRD